MSWFAGDWRAKTAERFARLRRRARSGSAAIEFAFLAPVLFLFLMGIMEIGIIFLADFTLQNSVNDAARMIRTGQVALNHLTQAQFRTTVCGKISPILHCDANLQIDVETYANFTAANFTNPLTSSQTLDPALNNWQTGTVCSIVLVRAFYTWSVATPFLTPFLANMAGNKHLIAATAAFRNEPYTTDVAGC